jgi:hypothetical protein
MTPAQFVNIFPAFGNTDQAVIAAQIALAAPHLNVARWDDFYTEGLACAVAHMLVVGKADGVLLEANDITSDETENRKVARDPALLMRQAVDWWNRSTYGQRFVYLRDTMIGKGALTAGPLLSTGGWASPVCPPASWWGWC